MGVRVSKWRPFTSTMYGDPKTHTTGKVWKEVGGNLYSSSDAAKGGDETAGSVGSWVAGSDGSSGAVNVLEVSASNVTDGTKSIRIEADGANEWAHVPITGLTVGKTYRFKFDITIPGHDSTTKAYLRFGTSAHGYEMYTALSDQVNLPGKDDSSAVGTTQDTFTFQEDLEALATTVYFNITEFGTGNDLEAFIDNFYVTELEDITNPYYKNYFGGYITSMELWPTFDGASHSQHLDTHYNITEPYPTSLSEDFTIIVNPFKKKLKKHNNTSAAHHITIAAIMSSSILAGGGNPQSWTGGVLLFSAESNDGLVGEYIESKYRRLPVDYDDLIGINQITGAGSNIGFGRNIGGKKQAKQVGTPGSTLPKNSTGFSQQNFIRIAAGLGTGLGPYEMGSEYNILDIAIIPHRPRGIPLT